MDGLDGNRIDNRFAASESQDDEDLDAMLEAFLQMPEIVATGGLETEEAPVATNWPTGP